jgi:hypothetical protein
MTATRIGRLVRSAEPLAPGRYTEPDFEPALSFEIGVGGAWVARQFVPGFFDIQQEPDSLEVIAVQFCRPTAIYGAASAEVEAGSLDAIAVVEALRANAALAVGQAERARIAGRPALTVDIETTTPRDSDPPIFSPVLAIAAGPIALASARRLRITWVDLPDGPLAVLLGGSIAGWDHALGVALPVVASIRFEAGG